MQSKAFGQIVNVANRQACTWLGYIDQLAPFKNRGHFLDPSSLVDSSSGESPPVEKAHIHLRPINPESLIEACIYSKKTSQIVRFRFPCASAKTAALTIRKSADRLYEARAV
jgi:hypothetical protein